MDSDRPRPAAPRARPFRSRAALSRPRGRPRLHLRAASRHDGGMALQLRRRALTHANDPNGIPHRTHPGPGASLQLAAGRRGAPGLAGRLGGAGLQLWRAGAPWLVHGRAGGRHRRRHADPGVGLQRLGRAVVRAAGRGGRGLRHRQHGRGQMRRRPGARLRERHAHPALRLQPDARAELLRAGRGRRVREAREHQQRQVPRRHGRWLRRRHGRAAV